MLFNGKYYNKPGHLGMTRAELKEALALGDEILIVHPISNGGTFTFDKTFEEMAEHFEQGKPVVCVDSGTISTITVYDGSSFAFYFNEISLNADLNRVTMSTTALILSNDNTTSHESHYGYWSATVTE